MGAVLARVEHHDHRLPCLDLAGDLLRPDRLLEACSGRAREAGQLIARDTILLDMPSDDCFVVAEHEGLFEPCVTLGDTVAAGDLVARVHRIDRTGEAPTQYLAPRAGF